MAELCEPGWGQLALLAVLFVLTCSDFFVGTVLCAFPGATRGREPTDRGVVVQGVLLALAYALVLRLANSGAL